ncbi:MAG: hypothetical protein QOG85_144 [Gaiellaceae bacterium]|jgi:hypothetical protein|nr:hypothetical protein [Gaiellaceae bacterium]
MRYRLGVPTLTVVAVGGAVACALWFQFGSLKHYGGAYLWPALIANFAASLGAFFLALAWDRRVRADELAREQQEFTRRRNDEAKAEEERRKTEARRLLELIVVELKHDRGAVEVLAEGVGSPLLFHIRTGAWAMSAEILGRLLSKSDLVAETSGLYDQLSELQYRLRFIAEHNAQQGGVVSPELWSAIESTDELTREIEKEFDDLLERLRQEAQDPAVDLLGDSS